MRWGLRDRFAAFLVRLEADELISKAADIRLRSVLASCGKGVGIRQPVRIEGAEHVIVEDDVSIAAFVHIWGQGGVQIGKGSMIASHVAITTLTHDPDHAEMRSTLIKQPITIGANVWIGSHAVIFPGVSIGDNAVIAAGAIVRDDVPADTVVGGIPARILRRKGGAGAGGHREHVDG